MKTALIFLTLFLSSTCFAFGPYYHINVAEKSFDTIVQLVRVRFPSVTNSEIKKLRPFYYGGSIGPDLGYFPVGEMQMSMYSHYLRSGDLTSTLIELASTPEEYAFALGWRTHVDCDEISHRHSVNLTVAESLGVENKFPKGVTYSYNALAHNKVESGGDVGLLRKSLNGEKYSLLVAIPLEPNFPNNRNLIEEAYFRVYAYRLDHQALTNVSNKMNEYLQFIPEVFSAMGYLPNDKQGNFNRAISALNNITIRPIFLALVKSSRDSFGTQAVLDPYIMNNEQFHRHENSRDLAVTNVSRRIIEDPQVIPNRNLDTGGPIFVDQYDPSATLLIELEKEHPEKTWESEYPPELANKLTSDWNRLLRQYKRRS